MRVYIKGEHLKKWETFIKRCNEIDELTDFEKRKANLAIQFLEREFGKDFLHYVYEQHEFYYYLVNFDAWSYRWITWFAEALMELKYQENYASLLNRIKDKHKFSEGISVLESAYKFFKAGFSIVIDPTVASFEKKPDLKLTNNDTDEELFVEVSVARRNKKTEETYSTLWKIHEPLSVSSVDYSYCGRIYRPFAEKHLDDIVNEIKRMIDKVKRYNKFQELVFEEEIEISIAPSKDDRSLQKWAFRRGLTLGQIIGPPINENEIERTKNKIKREQTQLPRNYPNILIVKNSSLFYPPINKSMALDLCEATYNCPHLLASIITGTLPVPIETIVRPNIPHYFIKTRVDGRTELCMILINKYRNFRVDNNTITKMINAFRNF